MFFKKYILEQMNIFISVISKNRRIALYNNITTTVSKLKYFTIMVRCSVLGCKSDSERKVPDLSFHTFPTNHNIRMNWIAATGRKHWTPRVSSRICSTHFEKKLLIKKKKTTFLTHDAVPLIESKNSTRIHVLKPVEMNDKSSIIAPNLTPHINFVTESDDTLSAISDEPETPQMNGSSVAKSTFYTQQRMQLKLKNALKQSTNRLKKLQALREKYRRLTKKVVKLENIIAELKAKSPGPTNKQPS